MKVLVGKRAITLKQKEFVAQGGQGAVYARGDVAYKVYTDPASMIPASKLRELQAITDPRVIRPQEVLTDERGTPVGYTMRFVKDAHTLCQLFAQSFRQRHAMDDKNVLSLVASLYETLHHVHAARVIVVDLNELNVLVAPDLSSVFLIDADSFQTPSHPATVLMESVRDRHAPRNTFSIDTDWFSFAVVSFQLFCGVHPYKGKHKALKTLDERMKANVSVFNPAVSVPRTARPVDAIPPSLREWYRLVFEDGHRGPPPDPRGQRPTLPFTPRPTVVSRAVHTTRLLGLGFEPSGVSTVRGEVALFAGSALSLGGPPRQVGGSIVRAVGSGRASPLALVFTEGTGWGVLSVESGARASLAVPIQDWTTGGSRVWVRSNDQLHVVDVVETSAGPVPSLKPTARVLEHATRLFDGVAIQVLLGSTFLTLLRDAGAFHLRVPELEGARIIDAKSVETVAAVVTEEGGRYHRWVFRFDAHYRTYDARQTEDIVPSGIELAVLNKGVAVLLDEDGDLELFAAAPGGTEVRRVEDTGLPAGAQLIARGNELLCAFDGALWRLAMGAAEKAA